MLLDLFFPKRCLGCDTWGSYFCPQCLKKIRPFKNQICPVCQKLSFFGKTHPGCQTKFSLDGLVSIFPYKKEIKRAIIKLKYKLVTDLARELIEISSSNLHFPLKGKLTIVPIPLHPRRERERGFNQAALLGELLAKKQGWKTENKLLKRVVHTPPQVSLKGKQREVNIKGVFELNQELGQKNLNLVIFDDVWTTGSTLKESGRILKKVGFKKIWGLTLAR